MAFGLKRTHSIPSSDDPADAVISRDSKATMMVSGFDQVAVGDDQGILRVDWCGEKLNGNLGLAKWRDLSVQASRLNSTGSICATF